MQISSHSIPQYAAPSHLLASSTQMHQRQQPTHPELALPSQQLLRGHKTVQILHGDQVYVLQATRQGKLILTK